MGVDSCVRQGRRVTGSDRPIAGSDDTEIPSVKQPFTACGKLALTLDEFAETQGVRSCDGTRRSRFFTTFRSPGKWLDRT